MSTAPINDKSLPSIIEEAGSTRLPSDPPPEDAVDNPLAFQDQEFLLREELRPIRLQLELLKPQLIKEEHNIQSTVVIFGSARIPDPIAAEQMMASAEEAYRKDMKDPAIARQLRIAKKRMEQSRYYTEARRLGGLISRNTSADEMVVVTGGGPGIMEAANRGAHEADARNIGMNIVLPFEQSANPYITPELSFQFHYFAIRKMHLLMRARTLVAFPGGFGTMDELFETLTLIQTQKITPVPVLLFGESFWKRVINFEALVDEGTIDREDLDLFEFVDTAEEAWKFISRANQLN